MALDFTTSNNAKTLKMIQQRGKEESNTSKTIEIDMDLIDKNPDNANIFSMNDVDILAKNIKEVGLLTPLNVYLKNDGRYEIASGHRRFEALKTLGRTTATCYVQPYPESEIEVAKTLIDSNIQTRKMTPLDTARALRFYHGILLKEKVKGDKRAQTGEHFNMSSAQVQRYWALLELIPELQKLADDPTFPFSAICSASTLNESSQKKLFNKLSIMLDTNSEEEDAISLNRTRIHQLVLNLQKEEKLRKEEEKKIKESPILQERLKNEEDTPQISVIEDESYDFKTLEKPRKEKTKSTPFVEPIVYKDENSDIEIVDLNNISFESIKEEIKDIEIKDERDYIDYQLNILKMELNSATRGQILFKDKDKVKNDLQIISELLDIIKENL